MNFPSKNKVWIAVSIIVFNWQRMIYPKTFIDHMIWFISYDLYSIHLPSSFSASNASSSRDSIEKSPISSHFTAFARDRKIGNNFIFFSKNSQNRDLIMRWSFIYVPNREFHARFLDLDWKGQIRNIVFVVVRSKFAR